MERIQSALSKAREARSALQEQGLRPVGGSVPVTKLTRPAQPALANGAASPKTGAVQQQVAAVQSAFEVMPESLQPWMGSLARVAPVLGALAIGLGLGLWSGLTGVLFLIVATLVAVLALWAISALALHLRRLQADTELLTDEVQSLREAASQEAMERAWLVEQAQQAELVAQAEQQERARLEAILAETDALHQGRDDGYDEAVAAPEPAPEDAPALTFASQRDPRLSVASANGRVAMAPPLRQNADDEQPVLALATPLEAEDPPLDVADVIRAIQFPESAEDVEGFAALRRVLPDRNMSKLIRATQDVLTLLARDAIYMDELAPDMARPDLWRRFAEGERGRSMAALGGVRDRSCLALTGQKMREDPVFRDAAHHFLRSFDRFLADIAPRCADEDIAALSDTRTARAFMLVGRVAGTFD